MGCTVESRWHNVNFVQWCHSLVCLHMIPIVNYLFFFFFWLANVVLLKWVQGYSNPLQEPDQINQSAGPKLTTLSYTSKRINVPIRIYSSGKPWSRLSIVRSLNPTISKAEFWKKQSYFATTILTKLQHARICQTTTIYQKVFLPHKQFTPSPPLPTPNIP